MNPRCRFVGLTATPYRLDSGSLHEGEGAIFDCITYDIAVQFLVDQGHLVPVIAKRGDTVADISGVKKRGGEFVSSEMSAAFDGVLKSACAEIIERGHDRRAWMVFCASVEQAELTTQIMAESGIIAEIILGDTPRAQRAEIIDRYKAGKIRCLVNCDVLTTGFNAPITDLLALIRATDSASLYVQIVGRAMRTHPGKNDALLLDFGGNVERHGPIDDVVIKKPGSCDGEAPAKACPECHSILPAASRQCPDCLYIFPPPAPSYGATAFDGAVMASQRKPQWLAVTRVAYRLHKKPGKPDSVRVEYTCGLTVYKEWLCPEHGGRAATEAGKKLARHGIKLPITTECLLAVAPSMACPTSIQITREGKYDRISGARFTDQRAAPTEAG
jgi:DNA repair protein RadD